MIDDSYLTMGDFIALKQAASLVQKNHETINDTVAGMVANSSSEFIGDESSIMQLESIWSEWQTWPEFQYFQQSNDGRLQESDSNLNHQARGQPRKGNPSKLKQTNQLDLLTTPIDGSVISSVNVLKLSRLSSISHPHIFLQNQNVSPSMNFSSRNPPLGLLGQLECEASNSHYDLRSLIRIFAPSTLFGRLDNSVTLDINTVPLGSRRGSEASGDLLSRAMEQALELSLRSPSLFLGHQDTDEISQAANLSNTKTSDKSNDSSHRASVLYQQLVRGHRFVERQTQTDSMARSEFVGLDLYSKLNHIASSRLEQGS